MEIKRRKSGRIGSTLRKGSSVLEKEKKVDQKKCFRATLIEGRISSKWNENVAKKRVWWKNLVDDLYYLLEFDVYHVLISYTGYDISYVKIFLM